MINKIVGVFLIALPFIALAILSIIEVGVVKTLLIFGITILLAITIVIGCYLIDKKPSK